MSGHAFWSLLPVLERAAPEHLRPGHPAVPSFDPPANLPAGLLLCHHRDRDQPPGGAVGEWKTICDHLITEHTHCSQLVFIFQLVEILD